MSATQHDIEASGIPQRRIFMVEATHGAAIDFEVPLSIQQKQRVMKGSLITMAIVFFVVIVTILASIHELGPDEQIVVKNPEGHWVKNGPWRGVLTPFYGKETRKATLLGPMAYAVVDDHLTGDLRHEVGPQLLFLGPYDQMREVKEKIVLEKDEYVTLVNEETAAERVLAGPQTVVPAPLEKSPEGKRQMVFLDAESAALVLERSTGQQHLVTKDGSEAERPFAPGAYQDVIEVRKIIHVLPHEAVIVRDAQGRLTVHQGADLSNSKKDVAFFLPPYNEVVEMVWSNYGEPKGADDMTPVMTPVTKMDLRARKMFFNYEVRTKDNVKLQLEGTIFWQVKSVPIMINATADPEGDVWHHARSVLIQAVSKATLATFMSGFNQIAEEAYQAQAADGFYVERGVELRSMEVTRFACVDAKTAEILQEIIQETTNRINRLQAQESENEVMAARLAADIILEKQRTEFIQTQASNDRLRAQSQGEAAGVKLYKDAATFIGGLSSEVPDVDSRVELYKLHKNLLSRNVDTHNLASGTASLFLTPEDVKLKLNVPAK